MALTEEIQGGELIPMTCIRTLLLHTDRHKCTHLYCLKMICLKNNFLIFFFLGLHR